jgi:broad specificity phosphatase PhoE
LTLVRHGQAERFLGANAALSALGAAQAAKLAGFWLRNRVRFDEVHSGTLPRQTHTEQIIAACFRAAGRPWPEAGRDPSWNEYDAPGVLRHVPPDDSPGFQRAFEAAMLGWLEAATATGGVEPWTAFRDRVSGAIRRMMEGPPGRRAAVFTSGGPIGFAVHAALQAPARSFLEVNWRIRNCSVTQFVFDRQRFTLDSFNSIGHLDDATLTYR